MDPLGASLGIVQASSLTRWSQATEPIPLSFKGATPSQHERESPFPVSEYLNSKIALWEGDLTLLEAQAVVNSTNESLNDKGPLSERIFQMAGPELAQECRDQLQGCRTGEAKISKGYRLPARYVIHTVGPRYNQKYKTAAESALFNCYRRTLQLMRENHLETLGLCVINSVRRGYPPEEGSHIAIRTVRRFLEKYGDTVDVIVFAVTSQDLATYSSQLPLYFPRTADEERVAATLLPEDTGNEEGEPVIPERKIRIMNNPLMKDQQDDDAIIPAGEIADDTVNPVIDHHVGEHSFAVMEDDHDLRRKEQLDAKPRDESEAAEHARRYQRWLKRSKTDNLSDIAQLGVISQSGVDFLGRPVIVFTGRNFPATSVDMDKAVAYFVGYLDPIVNRDYVIVYFHTMTTGDNLPEFSTLKALYNLVDNKYRRNLKAFYIVHPTFWSKVVTWFFTTFTASSIKDKVHSISGIEFLYDHISPDQLDVPAFVLEHDRRVSCYQPG
jgi:O-acetyl-ADP-ribose deacetylase (regulator of RNase III)